MNLAEKYLKQDLFLLDEEYRLREKFLSLGLKKIIDFHVHYISKNSVREIGKDFLFDMITTYPYIEFKHHSGINSLLYGDNIDIIHVAFAIPIRGWDCKYNNNYILQLSKKTKSIIPFFTGDSRDKDYNIDQLNTGSWYGIKMYPKQIFPKAKQIGEYYQPYILNCANQHGLCIMLHLPNNIIDD